MVAINRMADGARGGIKPVELIEGWMASEPRYEIESNVRFDGLRRHSCSVGQTFKKMRLRYSIRTET